MAIGNKGIPRITKLIKVIKGVSLLGLGSILISIENPIEHIINVKKYKDAVIKIILNSLNELSLAVI